jgi:exopolyphosphatase/pppGpp-phosphohydrolase
MTPSHTRGPIDEPRPDGTDASRIPGSASTSMDDGALQSILRFAEECRYDAPHAHQVTELALQLFDSLRDIHRLNGKERFWLQCAGLLHDIGWIEGRKAHHKTSRRLIEASPLLPLDARDRAIVGEIARYHRRALPNEQKHTQYAALPEEDRKTVSLLAALLRVADGLDVTHRSIVRRVTCHATDDMIEVRCFSLGVAPEERKAALKKGDLMTKVFRRHLSVEMAGS